MFVEVKKPKGGLVAKAQVWWRDRLVGLGMTHRYVFTREDVDGLLEEARY
jgi:hypothetical protein